AAIAGGNGYHAIFALEVGSSASNCGTLRHAIAGVCNARSVISSPGHSACDRAIGGVTTGIRNTDGHDLASPCDGCHADPIVRGCRCCSSYGCSMAKDVTRVGIVVIKIPP